MVLSLPKYNLKSINSVNSPGGTRDGAHQLPGVTYWIASNLDFLLVAERRFLTILRLLYR